MIVARDIEGTGLPFVAGVAAGLFLFSNIHFNLPETAISFLLPAFILILAARLAADASVPNVLAIFFLTGIFCSFNSTFFSLGQATAGGIPLRAVKRLRDLIDAIPYPSDASGPLTKALLTGDKSSLPEDIVGIFRKSGASHILALSGLHLGMIYLIVAKLSMPLGNSPLARKARGILTISICGSYTIMTGASASLVRAFIFIFLNETSRMLNRKASPLKIFAAALTIQLTLSPTSMASISFQLSYSAMLGIFLIFPMLKSLFPSSGNPRLDRMNPLLKIWQSAALSIACQVFTAPLAWHYFHAFPKYFMLANMIAMPLTSAIMALSAATIALSCLGICPGFLIVLDDKAIQAIVFCLKIISEM